MPEGFFALSGSSSLLFTGQVKGVGYLRRMDKRKKSLAGQRLAYLTKGNFHGVSANWLAKKTDGLFSGVSEFISSPTCPIEITDAELTIGRKLFTSVVKEKSEANFGKNFDCEEGLAAFLYAFILHNKPAMVVETGVANGITTNVIMNALEQTGGTLHSFDVDPRTKNVYSGSGDWNFHILSDNFERELSNQISEIGKVDLWIHDSNHGFQWQAFEYGLAASNLNPNGILVSDDIDSSTAWGIASESILKNSFGVFDSRKFFGVATI